MIDRAALEVHHAQLVATFKARTPVTPEQVRGGDHLISLSTEHLFTVVGIHGAHVKLRARGFIPPQYRDPHFRSVMRAYVLDGPLRTFAVVRFVRLSDSEAADMIRSAGRLYRVLAVDCGL